jgi:hypothetical protein
VLVLSVLNVVEYATMFLVDVLKYASVDPSVMYTPRFKKHMLIGLVLEKKA